MSHLLLLNKTFRRAIVFVNRRIVACSCGSFSTLLNSALICAFLSVLSLQISFAAENVEVFIEPKSRTLHYKGTLNEDGLKRVKALVFTNQDRIDWLQIRSAGGEINIGIDFGEFVFQQKLNVSVEEYCISSCANYIFTAAQKKRLSKNALLAYHGGASSTIFDDSQIEREIRSFPVEKRGEVKREIYEKINAYMRQVKTREQQFFELISVSQRITTLGHERNYAQFYQSKHYLGWYYSVDDLEKFGVTNVSVSNSPWELQQISQDSLVYHVAVEDAHLL